MDNTPGPPLLRPYVTFAVTAVGIVIAVLYGLWFANTFSKTLWDFAELVIVPLALAVIAYVFSRSEKRNEIAAADRRAETERKIAQDNQREAALQSYFDRMSDLLLKENLREAKEGDKEGNKVRAVARSRTVATLRRLDGDRKGSLLQFLQETGLISKDKPIIGLHKADLSKASLRGAFLTNANLVDTNFSEANLSGAILAKAELAFSDLPRANLRGADLTEAVLANTDLTEANLTAATLILTNLRNATLIQAGLREADLFRANLDSADLRKADITGADLSRANLKAAIVTNEQLATARSLKGATLPDGTRMPDDEDTDQPS